jgi:hypothetical protein
VLEFRHHDKSNQLGDLAQGSYSDWSRYTPVNAPATVPARVVPADPDHWQPLIYTDSAGGLMLQRFSGAQWCFVTSFALTKDDDMRAAAEPGPYKYGSPE